MSSRDGSGHAGIAAVVAYIGAGVLLLLGLLGLRHAKTASDTAVVTATARPAPAMS